MSRYLTAVAWPYANGPRHLGHVSGFGVPSDVYSRFLRMSGHDVLMVSGSDEHGTPVTVQADKEGLTTRELVDKYHRQLIEDLHGLGLSYDLYTRTTTQNHARVVQDIFAALLANGYVVKRTTQGAISPSTGRTLPDRYIEGTCPICGYDSARGDQCDNCGNQLDPVDLKNPVSKVNGETPEFRETEHFFIDLPGFAESLTEWLQQRTDWRPNVLRFSQNFIDDLKPRAITRDIDWGITIPLDGWREQPMKKFYVWFDAVIGYLSASVEWAVRTGDPEAWRKWWNDPETKSYYFMGKDNIVFHTVIWPGILLGQNGTGDRGGDRGPFGELNLPTEVVSSEFLTMSGAKFSTSRSTVIYVKDVLAEFGPDPLRYFIAVAGPENNDTDFTWDEFVRRNNNELANEWGNLVNRSISMAHKNNGEIPAAGELTEADQALLAAGREAFTVVGDYLAHNKFKNAISEAMRTVTLANRYLSEQEPWKLKDNPARRDTVLHCALQLVADCNALLTPFLPHGAQQVHEALGGEGVWAAQPEIRMVSEDGGAEYPVLMGEYGVEQARWESVPIPVGRPLAKPTPIFTKLDEALGETGPDFAPISRD